ncbi:putative MAPEG superfamily protein [Maritimibacter alkaliphilus HTCC2654]|uniref:Inner membrane protein n=1 Tax=Maritimibacter alkaliphilus HTCC2654 TaxID=314271 RepID=A3VFH3_9RHOB|nr:MULTISPECIES: MAPEG family protein [Maritimibacter]EAQ13088.1 hypothetical protein RB2654_11338 [Rhodobacterales bacterium HTCC2654] [Maritimibacter alkaliphilus HTCC2654]MBL6428217.1 MAPEG family protein [Maritimibacter sp.]TYP78810.1 putative MAPEG superfamily protein [Maritimibacter alkaliphilus HTCC2654]
MLFWIFAALILHAVYVFTPTMLFFPTEGVSRHMGGRDDLPEPSPVTGRARRALANWQESLPVFIVLALLAVVLEADATLGAAIFVLARVAYLPLYMVAIPGLRTLAWVVAVVGLLMMAFALV